MKKQQHRTFNITEDFVQRLKPTNRDQLYFDERERGFGVRITKGGVVSFVLNYRINEKDRRATLGSLPDRYWPRFAVKQARASAQVMKAKVTNGRDPLAELEAARTACTISDLAERYLRDYAEPKKRPASVRDDRYMIHRVILPKLGGERIASVRYAHIEKLHNSLKSKPYYANRVLALLSKMFSCAIVWELTEMNPVKGIARFEEPKRGAWVHGQQLRSLTTALVGYKDQNLANAIRLLILTGSRHSEVLTAKWAHFDFESTPPIWTKPSHATKQKEMEQVPLNDAAVSVLNSIPRTGEYLFPSKYKDGHRESLRKPWHEVLKAARLPKTVRIHDLRHSFASTLVNAGVPLYEVGKLMGHTRPQTTQRYAKLAKGSISTATQIVGKQYTDLLQ